MSPDEFDDWLADFDSCYRGIAEKRNAGPEARSTRMAWFRLMADVPLRAAKLATMAAFRGDILDIKETTPWERYPQKIRAYAKNITWTSKNGDGQKKRVLGPDGEPTYKCRLCHEDSGWITVVHPSSIKAAKDFEQWTERGVVQSLVVACSCEAGQQRAATKDRPLTFDQIKDQRYVIRFPLDESRPRNPIAWRTWLIEQMNDAVVTDFTSQF